MKQIELTQGKKTLVDDDVFHILNQWKWHAFKCSGKFYPARHTQIGFKKRVTTFLHHCVIGRPINGLFVDHVNGNPLDNRRENLRFVSPRLNTLNNIKRRQGKTTSKYPGVCWHKKDKLWRATAIINGKRKHLGCFKNEEEAGKRYQEVFEILEKAVEGK